MLFQSEREDGVRVHANRVLSSVFWGLLSIMQCPVDTLGAEWASPL